MSKRKRYVVEPCDNCGSVQPAPPRDRTWDVIDTHCPGGRTVVSGFASRILARDEARRLNEAADKICRACGGDGIVTTSSDAKPHEQVTRDSMTCRYCGGKGVVP